jgi:hypothetical protein
LISGRQRREGPSQPPVVSVNEAEGEIAIRPRKVLLERQPATGSRVAAFNRLHNELAVATELYLHRGDGGRAGVHYATVALFEYLTSRGIPPAALETITAIQTAIVDADRGTTSAIFRPTRRRGGGKPPGSDMERAFDGHIAAVMECCVRHCKAQGKRPYVRPASQMAAKLINESAWAKKITSKQLEKLRQRVNEGPKDLIDWQVRERHINMESAKRFPLEYARALLADSRINTPAKLSA